MRFKFIVRRQLVDIQPDVYKRQRRDAVDIQVYTDDPDLREVDKFANQFI